MGGALGLSLALLAALSLAYEFTAKVMMAGCTEPVFARCACRPSGVVDAACAASKVSASGAVDLQAAAVAHVGPAAELRVIPLHETFLSCSEDWSTSDIAGTWGGDAGEILLALAVAEHSKRSRLSAAQVEELLRSYISRSRGARAYFHTTASAMSWVQQQIGVDELDLAQPPRLLQPRILAALHDPRGQGCTLLRSVLEEPARFHVRLALVHDFIDAFHNLLWDRASGLRNKVAYHVSRDASAYIGRCGGTGAAGSGPGTRAGGCAATPPFAPLPYGRFTGILRGVPPFPGAGGASGSPEPPEPPVASLQAAQRPRLPTEQCPAVAAAAIPPAPAAPALLSVRVPESCLRARHTVLVPGNSGRGGAPWLVSHPQLVSLRRNATVPILLSALPGSDGGQIRDRLHEWGAEWARAAEDALGVSQRLDVIVYA